MKYKMTDKHGRMAEKIYLLGEPGSGTQAKGPLQDFYELRKKHLEEGTLFEDENFPADDSSMYFTMKTSSIEWRRPKVLSKKYGGPKFFVDGYSQFDAVQGECNDCWLVASIANLTLRGDLLAKVVPDDQDFDKNYAGIFHFRFWQYGKWIDVVVDDRLPYNKSISCLNYLRSRQKNEFWSPLLEKAYAKLHGSYEALYAGFSLDSMQDFTGGITEVYRTESHNNNLFEIICTALDRSALITCAMRQNDTMWLKNKHAYSITKAQYVQRIDTEEKVALIRLREPAGVFEWIGAWSDRAEEWKSISEEEKKQIGLFPEKDGEFWMSYEDFQQQYLRVEICNLCPHSASENHLAPDDRDWKVSSFESKWVKNVTAGGSLENGIFHHNPQYVITLTQTDKNEDKCTLVLGLMQKFRRQQKHMGVTNLRIGCEIFRLDDTSTKPLNASFFKTHTSVLEDVEFVELREHTNRVILPPGKYCIIPCTSEANLEGEFLLRVFSKQLNVLDEHDDDIGFNENDIDERVHYARESLKEKTDDDQAYELFLKYSGESGMLCWNKLKAILDIVLSTETKGREFPKDVCRSMVAMLDRDHSGYLDFEEFKYLWKNIQTWKNVFYLYDEDNSGTLNPFELRQALNSAGYHVNFNILNLLMYRYSNQEGELEFEDFLLCAIKLRTMISIFQEHDPENTKSTTFTFNKWIQNTLYA